MPDNKIILITKNTTKIVMQCNTKALRVLEIQTIPKNSL